MELLKERRGERERNKKEKKILEEITAKTFPNLAKNNNNNKK